MSDKITQNKTALEELSNQALIQHILETHHAYLHEMMPRVGKMAQQVVTRYGADYPIRVEVCHVVSKIFSDLSLHMMKEERILFPALIQQEESGTNSFGDLSCPINAMCAEHVSLDKHLKKLSELTQDYKVVDESKESEGDKLWFDLVNELKQFDDDTRQHTDTEENILFCRA